MTKKHSNVIDIPTILNWVAWSIKSVFFFFPPILLNTRAYSTVPGAVLTEVPPPWPLNPAYLISTFPPPGGLAPVLLIGVTGPTDVTGVLPQI